MYIIYSKAYSEAIRGILFGNSGLTDYPGIVYNAITNGSFSINRVGFGTGLDFIDGLNYTDLVIPPSPAFPKNIDPTSGYLNIPGFVPSSQSLSVYTDKTLSSTDTLSTYTIVLNFNPGSAWNAIVDTTSSDTINVEVPISGSTLFITWTVFAYYDSGENKNIPLIYISDIPIPMSNNVTISKTITFKPFVPSMYRA